MKEERIDNYVMGKMSAEERNSFEQEIANDAELQAEVALHRDVVRAIRMKAAKEHLQKVERQIRAEENRRMVFKRLAPVIALAACLVVGVFVDYDNRGDYKDYAANIEITPSRAAGYEVIIPGLQALPTQRWCARIVAISSPRPRIIPIT